MDNDKTLVSDELRGTAESQPQVFVGRALAPELRSTDWDVVKREGGQPCGAYRVDDSFGSWLEADC